MTTKCWILVSSAALSARVVLISAWLGGKSAKRTVPQETATHLRLYDTRDLQETVWGRRDYTSRNIGADMHDVIRQGQERCRSWFPSLWGQILTRTLTSAP